MAEINGTFRYAKAGLLEPRLEIPRYASVIPNASGRTAIINKAAVAVPLRSVVRVENNQIHCRYQSREEMNDQLRLSMRTKVIICCVTHDDEIERAWVATRFGRFAQELYKIRPNAVIVPNFSFFTDVPRTHTLYNRKRSTIVAELLSQADCPVIPHLSALTENDWLYWYELLSDNPNVKFVAKEFQTGLARGDLGERAIERLDRLQQALGRPLHPIAIGGGKYAHKLHHKFDSCTIVDSRPFFRSIYRQRLTRTPFGKYEERSSPTPTGAPIDKLLSYNLRTHEWRLKCAADSSRRVGGG